jgi:8-oxo-dGTP pyrophosphatase MutT (NUDIX family)
MTPTQVVLFDRLELVFAPRTWSFADERRADIDAHFAELRRAKPELWNGRVLVLYDYAIAQTTFHGAYLETDFASFLAWRDWDFPDRSVSNCFALGALRALDGAFVLGQMARHTANAGKIYFVGGTPDPGDVVGERVDLDASVLRELKEETGLSVNDVEPDPGWHAVFAGPRIAMLKLLKARLPAVPLQAKIRSFLDHQRKPELADVRIVRGSGDLDERMPAFVVAFLEHVWR